MTQNLVVDIMHDLFEGVCDEDMSEILIYFIFTTKQFTIEDLIYRMQYYDYGTMDRKNIPPPISKTFTSKNSKIKMSAKEMWTFVLSFGLMIGDKVYSNDLVWAFYLNLRQIVCLVTTPTLQKGCSYLLETLVEQHNRSFVELFKKPLKPKAHFLTHYGRVMRACGPLVKFWCMRFESKHQESKTTAAISFCKKNIIYTLAVKHQLKLANQLISNEGFVEKLTIGPKKPISLHELSLTQGCEIFTSLEETMFRVKWVNKAGYKFKENLAILTKEFDGFLEFGRIKCVILNSKQNLFFLCENLKIVQLDMHFDAYEVQYTSTTFLISYTELLSTMPLHIIHEHGKKYVSLRHLP